MPLGCETLDSFAGSNKFHKFIKGSLIAHLKMLQSHFNQVKVFSPGCDYLLFSLVDKLVFACVCEKHTS